MTKKIIAISVAATAAFGFWMYCSLIFSEIALFERFPEIDDKVVIKAHRMLFKDIVKGQYPDIDPDNEDEMDALFLTYVNKVQP